jgi:AbrB family looped-hinge helix DNA binding protein
MTLTIDGAGRVLIPKPLRDKLGLHAGSTLEVLEAPEGVTLKPADQKSSLTRIGRLLFTRGPGWIRRIRAIEEEREAQDRKNLGY